MATVKKYFFEAIVNRKVTDVISLSVETDKGIEEAREIAKNVAEQYPSAHDEEGVMYCYTEDRQYSDNELVKLERVVPSYGSAA